jgi:hypothetical protein
MSINTIETNTVHLVIERATLPTTTTTKTTTESTIFRDTEEVTCTRTPAQMSQMI